MRRYRYEQGHREKICRKENHISGLGSRTTVGKVPGTMVHLTVDGKKRTCDRNICISPGHIRADEIDMGNGKILDGKPVA